MPEILGTLKPPRQSSPPASPVGGQMYFDTGLNQLLYWNGTAWIQSGQAAGATYDSDQIGVIKAWSGSVIPTNWMLADGRPLSRVSFSDLFAAIGTTWGAGDGSTTFNIPDLRDRFLIGASASKALAALGGEAAHLLLAGESGNAAGTSGLTDTNHYHAINLNSGTVSADHAHNINLNTGTESVYHQHNVQNLAGGNAALLLYGNAMVSGHPGAYTSPGSGNQGSDSQNQLHYHNVSGGTSGITVNHTHNTSGNTGWQSDAYATNNHSHPINAQDAAAAHNNMPPWAAVGFIIKVTGTQIDPGGALKGATGQRGAIWYIYNSVGTPSPNTFVGELDGDWAIRKTDGENFQRIGGAWVDQGFTNRSTATTTAAKAFRNTAFTIVAGSTYVKIPLDSKSYDAGGNLFDLPNSRFVCPTAGQYQVNGQVMFNQTGSRVMVSIYKNGVGVAEAGIPNCSGYTEVVVADVIQCAAGDVLELWAYSVTANTALYVGGQGINYLSAALITAGPGPQGPQGTPGANGIAGTAVTNAARAWRQSSQSLTAGFNKVVLDSLQFDASSNLWNAANGRFVAPTTGYYHVSAEIDIQQPNSSENIATVFVNGAERIRGSRTYNSSGASQWWDQTVSGVISLNQGDYVELYVYVSAAASIGGVIGSVVNYLTIAQITSGAGAAGTGWKQYTGSGTPTVSGMNGDLCVRTSDGEVFQMVTGAWADQGWSLQGSNLNATYAARAYRSAALTVPASAWTKIALDTKSFDPGNNFSLANSRYVCPVSGYYLVEGGVSSIGTNGVIQGVIWKNGTTVSASASASVTSGTYPGVVQADIIQCNAGDYLELSVWTTQTGINNNSTSTYLAVTLVAATTVQQHPLQPASQARARANSAPAVAAGATLKIPIITTGPLAGTFDSGNNIDSVNNRYVCPVNGFYQVNGEIHGQAGATTVNIITSVYKNGVETSRGNWQQGLAAGTTEAAVVSDVVQCNAGDYLELWVNNQGSGSFALTAPGIHINYLSVTLVGTVPTAAPAHAAKAWRAAGFTPAASTWAKIPLDTVIFDPGSNFQIANGRYLCPVSGIYDIDAGVLLNVSATGTYTNMGLGIYKNGVNVGGYTLNGPAVASYGGVVTTDKIQCNAGDYLELWVYTSQSVSTNTTPGTNWFSVSLLTGTSQQGPAGPQGIPGNSIDAKTAARAYRAAALTVWGCSSSPVVCSA